jgi:hypothetical protein
MPNAMTDQIARAVILVVQQDSGIFEQDPAVQFDIFVQLEPIVRSGFTRKDDLRRRKTNRRSFGSTQRRRHLGHSKTCAIFDVQLSWRPYCFIAR